MSKVSGPSLMARELSMVADTEDGAACFQDEVEFPAPDFSVIFYSAWLASVKY